MDSRRPSGSALLPPTPDDPPPKYSSPPLPEPGPPPSYASAVSYPICYPPAYAQGPENYLAYAVSYIGRQNVVLTVPSAAPTAVRHDNYFGYSVFTMLFCCLPIGIGALVYSLEAEGAKTRGDFRTAATYSKASLILNHTALVFGIGIIVTSIVITIKILY